MRAIELEHPLIEHKLAILRDKKTGTKEFREIISELGEMLCYEAMKDARTYEVEIETPMESIERGVTTLPTKEREPLMHSGSCICVKNGMIAIKDETTPADMSC